MKWRLTCISLWLKFEWDCGLQERWAPPRPAWQAIMPSTTNHFWEVSWSQLWQVPAIPGPKALNYKLKLQYKSRLSVPYSWLRLKLHLYSHKLGFDNLCVHGKAIRVFTSLDIIETQVKSKICTIFTNATTTTPYIFGVGLYQLKV